MAVKPQTNATQIQNVFARLSACLQAVITHRIFFLVVSRFNKKVVLSGVVLCNPQKQANSRGGGGERVILKRLCPTGPPHLPHHHHACAPSKRIAVGTIEKQTGANGLQRERSVPCVTLRVCVCMLFCDVGQGADGVGKTTMATLFLGGTSQPNDAEVRRYS